MTTIHFLSKENAQILWEVIIDNESISKNSNTQQMFTKLLPEFYENEKTKQTNLLNMNKQFVSLIINLLKTNSKIINDNNNTKTKITFEELQEERVSKFQEELNTKQQEFTNAMKLPVPPIPTFSDNKKDEPLTEMEEIIRRTIAERNLEMEQIHSLNNKKEAENWIKGTSTSLKDEYERNKQKAVSSLSTLKELNINAPNILKNPKLITIEKEIKNISWAIEDVEIDKNITIPISTNQNDLFRKLKQKDLFEMLEELINKRFDKLETLLEKKLK